ncbi:MAG TPA: LuxR C-terminal-related transcriptional regulator [Trebonia sp.]|nr:LuxR C-terminal-related transcriptional regulator [Trebonia sp.]
MGEASMNSPAASGAAAGRQRWQLPADVSGFVGRGAELARLGELLASARLVTVTGPGGVGKTRLALRAAASAGHADGRCLVELSGLTDPELLPDTVGLRLRPRGGGGVSRLDALLGDLRGRELLLILDTCEHLAPACAKFVAAVLRETSGVTILTTSRQPLHLPGEEVLRLGPLPVPAAAGADLGTGTGDAVELFAQRAAAAVGGFTLTPAELPDVIRICRRLDGIPLAIELAAVRLRALPLAELAARIEAGLTAETGTRRGGVSRHQTLHAAIDWSYGLCTEAEKAAWRRLSVFAGSFDIAVARDVAAGGGLSPAVAAEVIGGLVDKSVVLPAGGGRHRLLDSVREYGAARLAEAGEDGEYRGRHLTRYLTLARDFSHRLLADSQRDRLSRLRAEHANLRAALEYGLAAPDSGEPVSSREPAAPARARTAARLAAALQPYWLMSGSIGEGMRWHDRVLARFAAPSPDRACALANRSFLGTIAGAPEAVAQASEAIAMAAGLGDDRTHARGCLALQFALIPAGRYAEAVAVAKQARWRLEALGREHALHALEMQLAFTYVHARDVDAAIEHCRRLLRGLCPGERWMRGNAHVLAALAYYQRPGLTAECANAAAAAMRETQEIGNLVGAACALDVFAWLAADAGRSQRAAWLLGATQALWERTGGRLSGSAVLARYHQRAAASAVRTLGRDRYAELHAAGAAMPLQQAATLAILGTDVLPEVRAPGAGADAAGDADAAGGWPGSDGLTSREREIAVLVAGGLSNRKIAERLVISKRTVDAHLNHIFGKLGLSSRVQLAVWLRDREPAAAGELSPAASA